MNFNILGIGLPQLILVFGLSMLLFGPKKMIQYAYQAGRWVSQMRVMWEEAAKNVQKEFHEAGLDLPTDLPTRGGRIDIAAAAMRIVEQAGAPAASATSVGPAAEPFTTLADSTQLPPTEATLATSDALSPSLEYPAENIPSPSAAPEATPEADPNPDQGKKYNAWLPD